MADQGSTEQLLELLIQLKKTTPQAAREILNGQPAIAYALITLMVSMGAINIEVFQKTLAQYHESNGRGHGTPVPSTNVATTIPVFTTPATTSTPPISALPPHIQPPHSQYRSTPPPQSSSTTTANIPTPPTTNLYGYPNTQQAYPPLAQPQPQSQAQIPSVSSVQQGYAQLNNYPAYGGQPQNQTQLGYGSYPPAPAPTPYVGTLTNIGTSTSAGTSTIGRQAGQQPQQQQNTSGAFRPEMLAAFPEDQKALIMHVVSMSQEQLNSLPPDQRGTYMQIRATLGIV